jgi:rhomboid protease GluP
VNQPNRKSILCPNCRKLISTDEPRCPYCGIQAPASRWKNNPLTRGWGSGEQLTWIIIYANIGMYLVSIIIDPKSIGVGLNPLRFLSPSTNSLVILGATGTALAQRAFGLLTFISANYLHGSILHILFNMIALYQISPLATPIFGPYRFFIIYTLSGIGGFAVSYLAGTPITIGASAALCGLIGAAVFYGKNRGGVFGQMVYKQVGGWAIGILAFGFLVPGINNWAHIGGMVSGALLALAFGYNEKKREGQWHRILAGALMLLTTLILLFYIVRGAAFLLLSR